MSKGVRDVCAADSTSGFTAIMQVLTAQESSHAKLHVAQRDRQTVKAQVGY